MPRLDHLDALLDEVRAAGLPVELAVEGQARPLDPGLGYRRIGSSRKASPTH